MKESLFKNPIYKLENPIRAKILAKAKELALQEAEVMSHIRALEGKIIVVKTGGSFMEGSVANKREVLADVAFMQSVNMLPVLVHGGGPTLSKRLEEQGIQSEFVNGHRITGKDGVQEIQRAMNLDINPEYVRILEELGVQAQEVHGEDIITAVKKTETNRETGAAVDLGFVGVPLKVDTTYIQ